MGAQYKGAIADAIVAEQLLLEGVPSGLLPKWQVQRMLVCGRCAGVVDVDRCREILEQEYQSALKELEEMDWDRGAAPADRAAESKRRYHLENRGVRNKQRRELRARTGR